MALFSAFLALAMSTELVPLDYNPWVAPTLEEKVSVAGSGWSQDEQAMLTHLRDEAYPRLMAHMGWPIDRGLFTVVKADAQGCVLQGELCLEFMQWGATAPGYRLIILRDPSTLIGEQEIDYRRGYIHEMCHTFRAQYVNDNVLVEEGLCEWASDRVAEELDVPNIRPVVSWEQIAHEPIPWANFKRGELDPSLLSYRFAAAFWEQYLKEDPDFLRRFHEELALRGTSDMDDEALQFTLMLANPWFDWRPYFTAVQDQALVVVLGTDEQGNHDLWVSLHSYREGKLVQVPIRGAVSHSRPGGGSTVFPQAFGSDIPFPYEIRYDRILLTGTTIEVIIFPPEGPAERRFILVP